MRYSLVLLAACSGAPGVETPPKPTPYVPDPGPPVDADCVANARAGRLTESLAGELGAFRVTAVDANYVHVRREGRALTQSEGMKFWQAFTRVMSPTAAISGGPGACASCLNLDVEICMTSLADITA